MSPSSRLEDWLTVIGLFALGLSVNVFLAAVGLVILDWVGLWPPPETDPTSDVKDAGPLTVPIALSFRICFR